MKNFFSILVLSLFCALGATTLNAQNDDSKVEYGIASLYSDDFAGRQTAYGDTYDPKKLTAAHKRHPYGTMLRVTRLDNKKSVTVKVTDKGPFVKGRVVDLSGAAADKIGLTKDGLAEVKVEVVSNTTRQDQRASEPVATAERSTPQSFDVVEPKSSTTKTTSPVKEKVVEKETAKSVKSTSKADDKPKTASARLVGKDFADYGLYKIQLEKPGKGDFGVQVASLSNYENVLKQVADLQAKWFDNILLSIEKGNSQSIYKIILGPFDDESSAKNYQNSLSKKHKIKGFVVNLSEITY
ncbi:MAG: hypothetical protein DHS20C18_14510 [Saprospiraceae bacterium]|nr:MAG: hypothetical protein DHS20C18_14510 [Saprospiraceae bacterium]